MYSHITLGTNDMDRAKQFYQAVMPILGLPTCYDDSANGFIGFSKEGSDRSEFFLCTPLNEKPATVGNGATTAFLVTSHDAVDQFYTAAMKAGATDEGAPGIREHYAPDYYAAYVRDTDGHKLCCVCRDPV